MLANANDEVNAANNTVGVLLDNRNGEVRTK